ncbi:MAG: SHD1 domain-containing protein [Verrucomicrobiota bacterium]
MMRNLISVFAVAFFALGTVDARTFTDDRGRQIEAELLGVVGANVVLKKNGQAVQWPLAKLSQADQAYVSSWLKETPATPKVRINAWEREGIGSEGLFEAKETGPGVPKNIPMLKSTEEKAKYRYYDLDLTNLGQVDAQDLHFSYVIYVIDASNQIVDFSGSQKVEALSPGVREPRSTEAATLIRTKTTSMTFGINALGNLSTGTDTDRSKERFGGVWARVYSTNGELLGEAKELHDELERLDFRFTGSTGEGYSELPLVDSFEKLKEFFESLPKPPGGLPKPPEGFPKPPGDLPKKPPFVP